MRLKIAEFAPMPIASEITATIVTPLDFQSIFAPYRRSLSNVFITICPIGPIRTLARSGDRLSWPSAPENNMLTTPPHPGLQRQRQTSSHHSASPQTATHGSIASTHRHPPTQLLLQSTRASFPASTRASAHHSPARRAPSVFPSPVCAA